jgi:hypothetical protein
MGENNENNQKGNNQPENHQPWMSRYASALPNHLHNLPSHLDKLLPKFDLEASRLLEGHIKKIILKIWLMNVHHDDVVC